jgi:hypothetical protein
MGSPFTHSLEGLLARQNTLSGICSGIPGIVEAGIERCSFCDGKDNVPLTSKDYPGFTASTVQLELPVHISKLDVCGL